MNRLEDCILAIGGTAFEVDHLRSSGIENDFCVLNILPNEKPNYIADFSNDSHMKQFQNKFALAFARAVPLDPDTVHRSLKNIASTLAQNGIFLGYFVAPFKSPVSSARRSRL